MTRATRSKMPFSKTTRWNRTWVWALGAVALALMVGLGVFLAVQFAEPRMRAGKEHPDLPGIDVSGLGPQEVDRLLTMAKGERCPCTCGFTLAECRHKDRSCPVSGPLLNTMVNEYRAENRTAGRVE